MAFALKGGVLPLFLRTPVGSCPRPSVVPRRAGSCLRRALLSEAAPVLAAVQTEEESVERPVQAIPVGALVLVAGAAGGVGQLTVARLLEDGYRVRAVVRDLEKAQQLFATDNPDLEIVVCDMRHEEMIPAIMEGVQAVCSCVGTTAFPSTRWKGDNDPKNTDGVALINLVKHTPSEIGRFVLVSSAGVTRTTQLPFSILNIFKVLTYRRMVEERVMESDLTWTILRPSRLTDAPYTSTDLNSLIKGTRGDRTSVRMSVDDDLYGEASRIAVAEAITQCLHLPQTAHQCYALESIEGDDPPEHDTNKWEELFASCDRDH